MANITNFSSRGQISQIFLRGALPRTPPGLCPGPPSHHHHTYPFAPRRRRPGQQASEPKVTSQMRARHTLPCCPGDLTQCQTRLQHPARPTIHRHARNARPSSRSWSMRNCSDRWTATLSDWRCSVTTAILPLTSKVHLADNEVPSANESEICTSGWRPCELLVSLNLRSQDGRFMSARVRASVTERG